MSPKAALKKDLRLVKSFFADLNIYEKVLGVFIFIYIIYFSLASFLRYDNYYAGRFDLGNMAQTVWNTTQGRIFILTDPNGIVEVSRLAFHSDFILILLAPFYMIWQSPKVLLLIQSIVLGFGAVFVYQISKHVLKNNLLSLVFGISYLLSPSVQRVNLYDFHAVALATTFLLAAFYYLQIKSYKRFLVFALLSAITKEQIWLIISLFGLFISFRQGYINYIKHKNLKKILHDKLFRAGALLGIVCFSIFIFLITVAIPKSYGGDHFALEFFGEFGDSAQGVTKGIVSSPVKVLDTLTDESRISYLKQLFGPLGYLPLASPGFLIFAAPDFLINMLSSNPNFQQIYYQYTAAITPFLYISSIYGIRMLRFLTKQKIGFGLFSAYLAVFAVYGAYKDGPLPFTKRENTAMFTKPLQNRAEVDKFLESLPEQGLISTSNNIGAHLSNRREIATIPVGIEEAEYIVFNLSDTTASPSMDYHKYLSTYLMNNPNYIQIFKSGEFIAFKKRSL